MAMSDPTLEYESRTSAPRRSRCALVGVLAVVSLLAGLGLAFLFVIVGFGVGDSWVIFPSSVPLYWWLVPVTLIAWPIGFFFQLAAG